MPNNVSFFVSSPNGDPAIDAAVSIFAHELAETATDPLLNAWWADSDGDENADKCSFNFGEIALSWTTAVSKHPDLISESIQECLLSIPLTRVHESSLVVVVSGLSWSLSKASLRPSPMRSPFRTAQIGGRLSKYMDVEVWGPGGSGLAHVGCTARRFVVLSINRVATERVSEL